MKGEESESLEETMYRRIGEASIYGNLGLFIGSGLSMALLNSHGDEIAVDWGTLLTKCAKEFGIAFKNLHKLGDSYPQIAENLIKRIARRKEVTIDEATTQLKQTIADLTSLYPDVRTREKYREYFDVLKPKWIITTNYDTVIESILTGQGHSLSPPDEMIAPADFIPVYHLHGIRTNPDSIVITQEDYVRLFRPNDYRQQKLPFVIKESLTLLIGYSLGDFNVKTAIDWSTNVFSNKNQKYPNGVIQLVFTEKTPKPPCNESGKLIYEYNKLSTCLSNIADSVAEQRSQTEETSKLLKRIENKYLMPSDQLVSDFASKAATRERVYKQFDRHENKFINGFLEILSRGLDELWKKARENNGFKYYDEYLRVLLEVIEHIDFKNTPPPALVQMIAFSLERVGHYMGPGYGEAHAAHRTWLEKGAELSDESFRELRNISKNNAEYWHLGKILNLIEEKRSKN